MSIVNIDSDQSRQVNWNVREKTDANLTLTVTLNSAAYNLSTYTFIADVFKVNDSTPFLTLTQGSGITNGGSAGTIGIALTDTQLSITPDQYFWKLRTTSPTDNLWINGTFTVNGYIWDGSTSSTATIELTIGGDNLAIALTIASTSSSLDSLGTTLQTAATDTPLDADPFNFYDAVDAVLKKITWVNIKATLKTYFDTIYTALSNTSVALTDAATIDVTAIKHTLTTASSRTFTISFTGDTFGIAITLNATSATLTLPSGHKGIYNGTPSGTNTLVITGATSGDVILVEAKRYSSVYYWVGRNSIR